MVCNSFMHDLIICVFRKQEENKAGIENTSYMKSSQRTLITLHTLHKIYFPAQQQIF